MSNSVSLISLFSGAGGLDLAFESTHRFSTRLFVESEPLFAETLRANQKLGNLGEGVVLQADLSKLSPAVATQRLSVATKSPLGLIGGPPCESFSSMGKQRGRSDERGKLVFAFSSWVARLPIDFFLMENVPGLLTIEKGAVFAELITRFERAGFAVSHSVLRAADFGAPTIRRRLFIVGARGLPGFVFPQPTHADPRSLVSPSGLLTWVASATALAGLPEPSLEPPGEPQGHVLIKHTDAVLRRFAKLKPGAVDRIRKRNRLDPQLPAPGLYAGNMLGVRSHIHPIVPRELTNREGARIQGFPDSYFFNGSRVAIGKQIANAVPLALGQALANEIAKQYFGARSTSAMHRNEPRRGGTR